MSDHAGAAKLAQYAGDRDGEARFCELFEGVVALFDAGRGRAGRMIFRSGGAREMERRAISSPQWMHRRLQYGIVSPWDDTGPISFATHEVFNQSPPFEDVDLFALDRPLRRGGGRQWRRGGQRNFRVRPALGFGRDGRARPRRQREPAEAADVRCARRPARRGRVSSGLSRIDGAQRACRRAQFDLGRAGQAGRRRGGSGARGKILHGGAGRDRASLPDHHDARFGGGARGAAGAAGAGDAGDRDARLRSDALRRGRPSAA